MYTSPLTLTLDAIALAVVLNLIHDPMKEPNPNPSQSITISLTLVVALTLLAMKELFVRFLLPDRKLKYIHEQASTPLHATTSTSMDPPHISISTTCTSTSTSMDPTPLCPHHPAPWPCLHPIPCTSVALICTPRPQSMEAGVPSDELMALWAFEESLKTM